MTEEKTGSNHEITLSDLRCQLDHIDSTVHEVMQHIAGMTELLAEFEPVLTVLRGRFKGAVPDMVSVASAARRLRGRGRT